MYEKYKKELSLAKNKLLAIDFFLEKDSDYIATFGNGTTWKIDFNGKWYDNYIYISIRNEASSENILGQKGVPIWMLIKIFGLNSKDLTTEEKLDFIIEHKNKIFDDFYRENSARGGFGLGLKIVKDICDKNLVIIDLQSNEKETKFTYRFKINENTIT